MERRKYRRLFILGILLTICNALLITDALSETPVDQFKIISRSVLFLLAIGFTFFISLKIRKLSDK